MDPSTHISTLLGIRLLETIDASGASEEEARMSLAVAGDLLPTLYTQSSVSTLQSGQEEQTA